jgi:molybdopterin converting factor small subunit
MKVHLEIIGPLDEDLPEELKATPRELSLPEPTSLHTFLTEVLKFRDTDKVVLVNGRYRAPNEALRPGDRVQIFPRLDGG